MKGVSIWIWLAATAVCGALALILGALVVDAIPELLRRKPPRFTWLGYGPMWGFLCVGGILLGICSEVLVNVMWSRRVGALLGVVAAPLAVLMFALLVGDFGSAAGVTFLGVFGIVSWGFYWLIKLALGRFLKLRW